MRNANFGFGYEKKNASFDIEWFILSCTGMRVTGVENAGLIERTILFSKIYGTGSQSIILECDPPVINVFYRELVAGDYVFPSF